jgi:mono/diheme cytochrome c family protein
LLKIAPADDEKLAASGAVQTLAASAAKTRQPAQITRLLDLAAAQPAGSPAQLGVLTALAGTPARGGAAARNNSRPIKVEAQPIALTRLMETTDAKVKSLVTRIESQLTWPGKGGAVEPTSAPLTPEQQALFKKGEAIYATICGACHQPNGGGLAGLAPPLANSEWVLGSPARSARIILHGLTGPIEVLGTKWQLEMPGLPHFTDEEVAGILTYIRRSWDNNGSPVTPAEVGKIRELSKGRSKAWTAEELATEAEPKAVAN